MQISRGKSWGKIITTSVLGIESISTCAIALWDISVCVAPSSNSVVAGRKFAQNSRRMKLIALLPVCCQQLLEYCNPPNNASVPISNALLFPARFHKVLKNCTFSPN